MIGISSPTAEAEVFVAGVVALFSHYPPRVLRAALDPFYGLPGRRDEKRPWQSEIGFYKQILDEFYAPILREEERQRARAEALRARARALSKPTRTPEEQRRVDEQVLGWRRTHGIPDEGLRPRGASVSRVDWGRGSHVERIMADLEARKRRTRERMQQEA